MEELLCTNAKCSQKDTCKRYIKWTREAHIVGKMDDGECPYYIKKRKDA